MRQPNDPPPSSSHPQPSPSPPRIKSKHVKQCFTLLILLIAFVPLYTFWISIVLINETTHLFGNDHPMHHIHNTTSSTVAAAANVHKPPLNLNNDAQKEAKSKQNPQSKSSDELIYHFVVSSDCSTFQKWQVLTQIHSAIAVNQEGKFTWIVSGCSEDKKKNDPRPVNKGTNVLTPEIILQEVNQHFPPPSKNKEETNKIERPNVHFTPDYSDMSVYGGPYADGTKRRIFVNPTNNKTQNGGYGNVYRFNNKPNSLKHWAAYLKENKLDENNEAIVLIDPDFLFLKKFELPETVTEPPAPGKPVAAKYGLGVQWKDFNTAAICGPNSPCNTISKQEANQYYTAGPPYIIHLSDVLTLSTLWVKLVPPTYDIYPLLYAEMYAYSMAAVHLKLRHVLVKEFMTGCMTGWPKVKTEEEKEALIRSSNDYKALVVSEKENGNGKGGPSSCFYKPVEPPPFLHYCTRYVFSSTPTPTTLDTNNQKDQHHQQTPQENDENTSYYFFAKRRVDHDILNCTQNPNAFTPWKSTQVETKIANGIGSNGVEWNVLSTCAVVRAINYARDKGGEGCA